MHDNMTPISSVFCCKDCKFLDTKTVICHDFYPCTEPTNKTEGTLCRLTASICPSFRKRTSQVAKEHAARQTKQAFQALTTEQPTLL